VIGLTEGSTPARVHSPLPASFLKDEDAATRNDHPELFCSLEISMWQEMKALPLVRKLK
jgi:hypothetical protein